MQWQGDGGAAGLPAAGAAPGSGPADRGAVKAYGRQHASTESQACYSGQAPEPPNARHYRSCRRSGAGLRRAPCRKVVSLDGSGMASCVPNMNPLSRLLTRYWGYLALAIAVAGYFFHTFGLAVILILSIAALGYFLLQAPVWPTRPPQYGHEGQLARAGTAAAADVLIPSRTSPYVDVSPMGLPARSRPCVGCAPGTASGS